MGILLLLFFVMILFITFLAGGSLIVIGVGMLVMAFSCEDIVLSLAMIGVGFFSTMAGVLIIISVVSLIWKGFSVFR